MRRAEFSVIGVFLTVLVALLLVCNIDAQVVSGRYIVVLRDDVANPPAAAAAIARANGLGLGHVYSSALKGFSASIPDAALQAVKRNPKVGFFAYPPKISISGLSIRFLFNRDVS